MSDSRPTAGPSSLQCEKRLRALAIRLLATLALATLVFATQAQAQGTATRWEVDARANVASGPLTSEHPPRTQTLFLVHADGDELEAMLRVYLPDWLVHRVAAEPSYLRIRSVLAQLRPSDAVVWIETDGPVARVTLLDSTMENPRTSPLSVEPSDDQERTVALVVQGLVRELPIGPPVLQRRGDSDEVLMQFDPPIGSRRRAASGASRHHWFLQVGPTLSTVPRLEPDSNVADNALTGGVRVGAGRWVGSFVRVGLLFNAAFLQYGTHFGAGFELTALSRTRLRVGAALSFEMVGGYTGLGGRLGLPLEAAIETRRGAISFRAGPTLTATSTALLVGYQLALGWELH